MKKIKEGLINEEIVRRYPGSYNNGGNNIVDKGKGGGPISHDMGKLLLKSWGTWMQICLEGADVRGIKPSFVRDKIRWHSPTKVEEIITWYTLYNQISGKFLMNNEEEW